MQDITRGVKRVTMKFSVDEIWEDRSGCPYLIIDVQNGNFPIIARDLKSDTTMTYTKDGREVNNEYSSPQDLVFFLGLFKDFPEYQL